MNLKYNLIISGIVPILSEVTFALVEKAIPEMDTLALISTSVPTPPWPPNV